VKPPNPQPRKAKAQRRKSDDHYAAVADVYREAVSENVGAVARYVASTWNVPLTTANRWLKEARRRGLLAPANRVGPPARCCKGCAFHCPDPHGPARGPRRLISAVVDRAPLSSPLELAALGVLRKLHRETDCGINGSHWAECERLADELGVDADALMLGELVYVEGAE